jgi:hypothetical protein
MDARGQLKHEKLILVWRLKENAKADLRQTIREEYDQLPEVYDRRLWEDKVERTFPFTFERYPGEIAARQHDPYFRTNFEVSGFSTHLKTYRRWPLLIWILPPRPIAKGIGCRSPAHNERQSDAF